MWERAGGWSSTCYHDWASFDIWQRIPAFERKMRGQISGFHSFDNACSVTWFWNWLLIPSFRFISFSLIPRHAERPHRYHPHFSFNCELDKSFTDRCVPSFVCTRLLCAVFVAVPLWIVLAERERSQRKNCEFDCMLCVLSLHRGVLDRDLVHIYNKVLCVLRIYCDNPYTLHLFYWV